jgi:hypothetical protein
MRHLTLGPAEIGSTREQHLSFIHLSTISTSPRYPQIQQLCYLFCRFVSNTLPSLTRHGDSAQLRMLLCLQGISDSVASHLLSCSSPSSSPPRETCESITLLENNSKELYNRLINCPIGFQTNMTDKIAVDIYQNRYQRSSPSLCTVRHLQPNIQRAIAASRRPRVVIVVLHPGRWCLSCGHFPRDTWIAPWSIRGRQCSRIEVLCRLL